MMRSLAERPAAESRSILVSFSPLAGASSTETRARQVAAELHTAGYEVLVTSDLAELEAVAAQWHATGQLRCVLACGGDGTAAIVRNHTPLETPLLIVPLGTENLLGQYVSQSASPATVRTTVEQGVAVALDLGQARSPQFGSRYFLSMISAGFDAEVVRRLHQQRRGNITRCSYIQPTLHVIRSYEYPELQLYCDGADNHAVEPVRCRWVFSFNLPLYARGWQIAPDAEATDGLMDICTFQRGSLGHVARYLWHVMRRSHLQLEDANLVRCSQLRIEAAHGADVAYQVDGDFGGSLPVDVDILAGRLRLYVMPHIAERLGFSVPSGATSTAST